MHTSGELIESRMLLPNIEVPQKLGSAISYYRRYSLMSISGLPTADDDGNDATLAVKTSSGKISQAQVTQLDIALDRVPTYRASVFERLYKEFGSADLKLLPVTSFELVMKTARDTHARGQAVVTCV